MSLDVKWVTLCRQHIDGSQFLLFVCFNPLCHLMSSLKKKKQKILFIYLCVCVCVCVREREREAKTQAEGEAGSMQGA